jgi:hypothetical protein
VSARPLIALPSAYKARYARLHPAGQMVGLMMWLPALFVILFSLTYIGGLHAAAPHNVPIGVVGTSADARQLADGLHASSKGTMSGRLYPSVDIAAVRNGTVAALFTPGAPGHSAEAVVASANGAQLSSFAQQALAPLAAAEKTTLHVRDLAPLPPYDASGTVPFFVALGATIGGHLMGMFCGLMGAPLRRRVRWGLIVAVTFMLSLFITVMVGPVLGAVSGHFLQVWAVTWATAIAAGLLTNALAYYLGRFVAIPALVLFVFVNVPASGGSYPVEFVPPIFRWLHHIVLGGYNVPLLRRALYGVGPSTWSGVYALIVYAAIGIALALAGPPYAAWRLRRRTRLQLSPGGMFGEASRQLHELAAGATDQHSKPGPNQGDDQ